MKNSMVKMIKKVTAAFLAAATVMGATVAATPTMVRAAETNEFNGIDLNTLPDHPTNGMDIMTIRNAYEVGGELREINTKSIESGDVLYVTSISSALDPATAVGKDVVVVYSTYFQDGLFGIGRTLRVSCKSLVDGQTFDLGVGSGVHFYELNKVQYLNVNKPIDVDDHGLETFWGSVYEKMFGWIK